MRRSFFSIVILSVFFSLFSACSTWRVMPVTEISESHSKSGIVYSLPRTVVVIDVEVERTERIRGPFYQYADKFLGIQNVINQNTVEFRLTNISIEGKSQPDPAQYYLVETQKGLFKDRKALLVGMTETGLLLNVNEEDNSFSGDNKTNLTYIDPQESAETFVYFADENLVKKVDTVLEKISMDTITIEKTYLKTRLVEKKLEDKAKDAADYIMMLRENRMSLLSGYQEIEYSKESLEYMSGELEKMEKDYVSLFRGITFTNTYHYRFAYIPKDSVTQVMVPLFRFSEEKGVLDSSDYRGDPVSLLIQGSGQTSSVKAMISLKEDNVRGKGFYYRLPEEATLAVYKGDNLLAEVSFPVAQFGPVNFAPLRKSKAAFYPETGALKIIGRTKEK